MLDLLPDCTRGYVNKKKERRGEEDGRRQNRRRYGHKGARTKNSPRFIFRLKSIPSLCKLRF